MMLFVVCCVLESCVRIPAGAWIHTNLMFVMSCLELIPRRRRLSRRLGSSINKRGKGVVQGRHAGRERGGGGIFLPKSFESDSDYVLEYTVVRVCVLHVAFCGRRTSSNFFKGSVMFRKPVLLPFSGEEAL